MIRLGFHIKDELNRLVESVSYDSLFTKVCRGKSTKKLTGNS